MIRIMEDSRRYALYTLLLIMIIASFLRIYNINKTPPGLYPDEAMNGNNASEALSKGDFKVFYPENNGREGLYIDIQALSIAAFGNRPWALRIVSSLFGILTVLGLYLLAGELFYAEDEDGMTTPSSRFSARERIALLSSFLIATSFWHINFSRIGFRAIMAPAFSVFAVYFFLKAANREKYRLSSVFCGICLGLGMYSYIAFRPMPLLIGIIFVCYFITHEENIFRRRLIKLTLMTVVTSIIVFAPLGVHFLKTPRDFFGRTLQISVLGSSSPLEDLGNNIVKTVLMFNSSGDRNWRHNYKGQPELFWPVGIMFLIGTMLALVQLFRQSRDPAKPSFSRLPALVMFSWLFLAALPVVISDEGIPHSLRAILMIPPVFILAASGGVWLYERLLPGTRFLKIRKVLLPIFFLLLVFHAYHIYFISWGGNRHTSGAFRQGYVKIGEELNSLPLAAPKYVIVKAEGVEVRGIPMPAQTVMFITDTFTAAKQRKKNIHYILPDQTNIIPEGSYVVTLK